MSDNVPKCAGWYPWRKFKANTWRIVEVTKHEKLGLGFDGWSLKYHGGEFGPLVMHPDGSLPVRVETRPSPIAKTDENRRALRDAYHEGFALSGSPTASGGAFAGWNAVIDTANTLRGTPETPRGEVHCHDEVVGLKGIIERGDEEIKKLRAELSACRTALAIDDDQKIVCEGAEHGNILVDTKGGQRQRISPLTEEVLKLRAENERLGQFKTMYDHAIGFVDRVFQVCSENPKPLLPDFLRLGDDKFRGVVRLAEAYNEAIAERDTLRTQLAKEKNDFDQYLKAQCENVGVDPIPSPDHPNPRLQLASRIALKQMDEREQLAARTTGDEPRTDECETCGIGYRLPSGRCDHCDSPPPPAEAKGIDLDSYAKKNLEAYRSRGFIFYKPEEVLLDLFRELAQNEADIARAVAREEMKGGQA